MRTGAWLLVALVGTACGSPDATPTIEPAEIIGHVELSADVPTTGCQVFLEGSPRGALCDESGGFDIQGVLPGRWDVRIVAADAQRLPDKRVVAGANAGFVTDLGPVRLLRPGAVGGRVTGGDLAGLIVAVPAYGVVTAPNTNGGYLLTDVPPGLRDVVLIAPDGTAVRAGVAVVSDRTTVGVDLDLAAVAGELGPIDGRAIRGDGVDGDDAGLTVELVNAVDGDVVASATTDDDGAFSLPSAPGVFVVRARDGDNPITAIIPAVVPSGPLPRVLASPLVVYAMGGDLDGDGVPDADDADDDGDGVPDGDDAFPYDPAETADADHDGLGDRADLATQGPGLDTQNPTPDSDDDGRFDFEDDCPADPDPAQLDSDGDGVGDVCDNCPAVANPDQADSVGDGTGDACRACRGSEDCPSGQTCEQGRCVECTVDSQCGGEVCDAGLCIACSATHPCGGALVCNEAVGVCQECLTGNDCAQGDQCVAGRCFPGCTGDLDCGGGAYCVSHACVACRDNADCPSTQWCDAGLCQAQCSTDANCTGGRVCDLATRTCVQSCDAGCAAGQACDAAQVCRDACDLTFPCGGTQVCDLPTGLCEPECTSDSDCTGFDVCDHGQCTPSGACQLDTDCPASEMCSGLGQCVARPTTYDAAAGAYTCASACDCKLGEACGAGHCVADGVPTRYAAAGATGDGLTIASPTGDLAAALGGLATGDVVAIRAGDTLAASAALPEITAPGVSVQGGYVACSAKRWVRDAAQSSRLEQDAANTDLLHVTGTFAAPATGVTVRGLTLAVPAAGTYRALAATYAPGLTVQDIDLELAASAVNGFVTGIAVSASPSILIERIALAPTTGPSNVEVVSTTSAAGTIHTVSTAAVTDATSIHAVHVKSAIGPVVVDGVTTGPWSAQYTSDGVFVEATPAQLVTVRNGHFTPGIGANGGYGAANWSAIRALDSGNVAVSDSTLDGVGFLDPGPRTQNAMVGVWFDNSSGTVDRVDVAMPTVASANVALPFVVTGPGGDVTFSDCTASGGGATTTFGVELYNVTAGTVTITRTTIAPAQASGTTIDGVWASNSQFVMTDSNVTLPGAASGVYGFYLERGARGRIERSRFRAGGNAGVTGYSVGGYLDGASRLELYDSWLAGGRATSNFSAGLWLYGNFDVRAIGNTLDGGGIAGQGVSVGVVCTETVGQGTARFSSNLVEGGDGLAHYMIEDVGQDGGSCSAASAWDHSYFQFRASGVRDPSALEAADTITNAASGVPDAAGNLIGDATSCFDAAFPAPDFHLAAGSPCVNRGVAGTRANGSALTLDLLGGPRTLGGTTDIGAHEVQ